MKIFLIFFTYLMLLLHGGGVFAFETEKIESYLDKLNSGHVNHNEHEKKLSEVIVVIEAQLKNDEENPYLWYLKGRSTFAALAIHSVVYGNQDNQYREYQKLVPIEFEKALSLNKNLKVLTEQQLNNIYGSPSVKIEATRQYIELKNEKSTLDKKEHLSLIREWIIPLLIKQNKFDEALKELDYIDKHFPENTQGDTGNIAWRQHYEKEIELQKSKVAKSLKPKQEKPAQPAAPEKPDPVVSTVKKQPVVKAEEPNKKDKVLQEDDNKQLVTIGIAIAILILIGFMVARRRKK